MRRRDIEQAIRRPRWLRRTTPTVGTWWWTALIIVVPVVLLTAIAITVLLLILDVPNNPAARIELVKAGLAVGAGTGGIVALVLAGRRQWSNEQTARATEHDASERRITELYTKAVEQLGSSHAAVRLGGLYALERLGQNTESQRETILNVICAYLRMPYTPAQARPESTAPQDEHDRYEQRIQELQVRLTAQRIVRRHRRNPADSSWWDVAPLDLAGAYLAEADLSDTELSGAVLAHAVLTNAFLDRTVLTKAKLASANLTQADLGGARLTLADLTEADLTEADLTEADLTRANLTSADLTGADLTGSDLTSARLIRANLTRANLYDAILTKAELDGTGVQPD